MDTDQGQANKPKSNRRIKWAICICVACFMTCCGFPTLIYTLFVPTLYETRFGQPLPKGAEVVHDQWDQNGFDVAYRFVIAYEDNQTRDQIIQAWSLQPGQGTRLSSSDLPVWWPVGRIDQINASGEVYSRIDNQTGNWWSLWVDQENGLLYIEEGTW